MRLWFRNCPRCQQGRLFVMRSREQGAFYLHCEECEWAWDDPLSAGDPARGTLGIDRDDDPASVEDLAGTAWRAFACRTAED